MTIHDLVDNPAHYTSGNIDCISFIEDKQLGFHLGNAVKYIIRCGKKEGSDPIIDCKKAIWYLERYISQMPHEKNLQQMPYDQNSI